MKPSLSSTRNACLTRRSGLTGTLLLLLLAACADAPASGPIPRTAASLSSEAALDSTLSAEKRRIASNLEESKAAYDSLKAIWDQYGDGTLPLDNSVFAICDPLQYVGTVKVVGPSGGDVDFGPHKLSIPSGALDKPTVIAAEGLTSLRVHARFAPHGLVFLQAPVLSLSRKHCAEAPGRTHRVAYLGDDADEVQAWYEAEDDDELGVVRAYIWHFSAYAVAY